MKTATIGIVLAAIGGLASCRPSTPSTSAAAASADELPRCDKPAERECNPSSCGGNSPLINAFPIHGFRPDGECSAEGAQLVPGSIEADPRHADCTGATLDFDGSELVGRKGERIVCRGEQLVGATFQVRSWRLRTARIKVAGIQTYTEVNGEARVAYRLENASDPGAALCDGRASDTFRKALGLKPYEFMEGVPPPENDLVIPVRSELYEADGSAVEIDPGWDVQAREWIHLACVDDALAKRSLHDLHTDNLGRSRAALRMLTADYCGGVPLTLRGVKVAWAGSEMIEARWTQDGAVCLSEPRLLHQKSVEIPAGLPKRLRLGCTNCTAGEWAERARTCEKEVADPDNPSTRRTERWVLPPCETCPRGGCKPRPLESFIVQEGR